MNSLLKLQVRSVYGTERIYPMNAQAHNICELLRRKTLNKDDVMILQKMGFAIEWVALSAEAV